jgi:hypothetical protein
MSNRQEEEFYRQKYLKYKAKYLEAKNEVEGGKPTFGKCADMDNDKTNCGISVGCEWQEGTKTCIAKKCSDYGVVRCAVTPGCTIKDKFTIGVPAHCEDKPCKDFSLAQTCPQADTWNESRVEKCMWDPSVKKCTTKK